MFIRVGNRIINTDHISAIYFDAPARYEWQPSADVLIVLDTTFGSFGFEDKNTGTWTADEIRLYGETAEAFKDYAELKLVDYQVTTVESEPTRIEPPWNQNVLGNEGMVSKSTVYSTEAELPF